MNSQDIAKEIERTLLRYKLRLIGVDQARDELALYNALLKAEEQAVIEEKLDRIEAVLESRDVLQSSQRSGGGGRGR
jgi:ribosome assembly protein YihI (activator of Der GTPase)